MFDFKIGAKVKAITFPDDSTFRVGQNGVEKILVNLQYGQMAGVPWFSVFRNGKEESQHNAAHISSVELF